MDIIKAKNLDLVFGKKPQSIIPLLRKGVSNEEIRNKYNNNVGLRDISINFEEGKTCVVMGLSGSGKSTLLRCLNGLNKPTAGTIEIFEKQEWVDITSCTKKQLTNLRMNSISFVFQSFALLKWLNVQDNVAFGLDLQKKKKSFITQTVQEKLKLVGLGDWGEKRIQELSGGMQQRVGLARALATEAKILLMDEPFSALDPLIRHNLQGELNNLQKKLKKTIVFVSHDLDEAVRIGDKIVIMNMGEIVQAGTAQEIIFTPENSYVKSFVNNINAVNALYASILMKSFSSLPKNGSITLDSRKNWKLFLDEYKFPKKVESSSTAKLVLFQNQKLQKGDVVMVDSELDMKKIVEIRYKTDAPVLVISDKKLLGVINEQEIFCGLTGQITL